MSKTNRTFLTLAVVAMAFATLALPAGAASISLTATGDNTILDGSLDDDNYGDFVIASGTAGSLTQRSILRFDVSALDGLYSTIDSITLRLFYWDDSSPGFGTEEVTTNVHAITAANRAWIAGTSTGGAGAGESTWNNLAHSATPWAGSAGLSTAGTDYDSTVLGSQTIDLSDLPAAGTAFDFTFTGTSAALTALIDTWMVDNVDNSQANPGLLMRDPDPTFDLGERNRFVASSMEDANAALRPELIVNYTVIPEPATMSLLALGGIAMLRRRRRA